MRFIPIVVFIPVPDEDGQFQLPMIDFSQFNPAAMQQAIQDQMDHVPQNPEEGMATKQSAERTIKRAIRRQSDNSLLSPKPETQAEYDALDDYVRGHFGHTDVRFVVVNDTTLRIISNR